MAVDWVKVEDIARQWGVPLLTFAAGIAIEHWRLTRDVRRQEENRRQDEREARITKVVETYVQRVPHDAQETGSIVAGVLTLLDSTECCDFCERVKLRVQPIDAPIPEVRRKRLRDEQLHTYFQRCHDEWISTRGLRPPDYDKVVASLT